MEFLIPGDGEGWPGGVRQQYNVAQGLLEGTIRDVKRTPSLQVHTSVLWHAAWQSVLMNIGANMDSTGG